MRSRNEYATTSTPNSIKSNAEMHSNWYYIWWSFTPWIKKNKILRNTNTFAQYCNKVNEKMLQMKLIVFGTSKKKCCLHKIYRNFRPVLFWIIIVMYSISISWFWLRKFYVFLLIKYGVHFKLDKHNL